MGRTYHLHCIDQLKTFNEKLAKANQAILELIPKVSRVYLGEAHQLLGLTEAEMKGFAYLSTEEISRLAHCGFPLFTLYINDVNFMRSTGTLTPKELRIRLKETVTRQIPGADPEALTNGVTPLCRSLLETTNRAAIDAVEVMASMNHPLSLALFGIPMDELPNFAQNISNLLIPAREGIPFFRVNPIWTQVDILKKEAFTELRGKALSVYLSDLTRDKIPKSENFLEMSDEDRNTLAKRYIHAGARSVLLTTLLRMPIEMARKMYRKEIGKQPVPGQMPTDHLWFRGSSARRKTGAMLLIAYARWYQYLNFGANQSRLLALYMAYECYRQGEEALSVDLERFELLTRGWSRPSRILEGDFSAFKSSAESESEFRVIRCSSCRVPTLLDDGSGLINQCHDCKRRG